MGRRKPRPLRYGGFLSQEEEESMKEEEEPTFEDGEVLEQDERVPVREEDLVCCLSTWRDVKMSVMDSRSVLMNQGRERIVTFGVPDGSKSKCEFAILEDSGEEGVLVLDRGRVGWSSFKPKIPCSRVRRALGLLQEGGFLAFTCEILGMKRSTGKNKESVLNTNIRIYLSRRSLDSKLLSRKREGKSSLRTVFSWLNEELKFPMLEGSGTGRQEGRSRNRYRSTSHYQTVQIKPDELYAVFQEYEVSMKRMGSNQRDQGEESWRMMGLTSELRSYQKDAVLFALRVEKEGVQVHLEYPPYWFCLKVVPPDEGEEKPLYINMINGEISLDVLPQGGGTFLIRGGFLCDEMGLGKSLEIIALILMNPRTESHEQAREKSKRKKEFWRETLPSPCISKESESDSSGVECPCGVSDPTPGLNVVRCEKCGVRFHHECCIGDWTEDAETDLLCSLCQSTELSGRLKVKATLIVAPGSIVDQWLDEFSKHIETGRLRVAKYQGVRHIQNNLRNYSLKKKKQVKACEEGVMIRTRRDILNYDVVLTSYEILKEEIYHVLDQESLASKRSLRYKKTYPILASLLINIDWWRIVLDEAQMTEGYSLVSKMTSKLSCCNKWCVSGTPIVRSCSNDLIGLLLNLSSVGFHLIHDPLYRKYLGYLSTILYIKPSRNFNDHVESDSTISDLEKGNGNVSTGDDENGCGLEYITSEYKSMKSLMVHLESLVGPLFYRREMNQVKEEINIPPVFYGSTYLSLSSIERFFYVKQCEAGHNNVLSYPDVDSFSRNRKDLDSLVTMLRLACIHPQLGAMGINNRSKSSKGQESSSVHLDAHHVSDSSIMSLNTGLRIMTMDQILDKLLNKCRIDIEESVRKYVMNTLGLAGIYFSSVQESGDGAGKPTKSVFYYKQVLDIRREDRVDVLQQIHTLWNLGEICDDKSERRSLLEECSELEAKYRSKYYKDFLEKHESFSKSRDKANSLFSEEDRWWHVFKRLTKSGEFGAGTSEECVFLDKVESFQYEFRSARDGDSEHYLPSFNSIHGLVVALDLRVQQMQESRGLLLDQLAHLELLRFAQQHDLSRDLDQDTRSQLALDEIVAKVSSCSACQEKDQGPKTEEEDLQKNKNRKTKTRDRHQPRQDSCIFCVIQSHIEEVEYSLYTIKKKNFSRYSESSSTLYRGVEEDMQHPALHHDSTYLRDSEAVATLKFLSRELKKTFKSGPSVEESQDLQLISQISAKQIKYIESLKLELSNAKVFVSATRQLVNSYLELIDCKQRIQVIKDDGSELSSNHNNIIHQSEIPLLTERYESERISALGTRRNLKSQQKFLCNLKLQQQSKKISKEEEQKQEQEQHEMCPICLNKLKEYYSQVLLPCAHILCIDCYRLITTKKSLGGNKAKGLCPKCRYAFQDTSVVLIVPDNKKTTDTQVEDHNLENGNASSALTNHTPDQTNRLDFGMDFNAIHSERILGNFGTKIEAIIKHIKWIINYPNDINDDTYTGIDDGTDIKMDMNIGTRRGKNDKVIIFSDFQSVIDILSSALHLNEIKFRKYAGGKSEYHIIREFSSTCYDEQGSEEKYRVLLCNHLNVGKGVNITAANHIVFVSPLLNKSDELQAIGRIVRMGQTKTPHIWNFIINDSVDELISQYLSNFYSTNNHQNFSSNSTNQHSLNLKIIQHVSDTNYSNFRQSDK